LGFPSGPTSPACATTIGAVCACDGAVAKCIAVKAVVASSARRSLVMMVGVPGKMFGKNAWRTTTRDQQGDINKAISTRRYQQGLAINE
jgi:hypothetical protein